MSGQGSKIDPSQTIAELNVGGQFYTTSISTLTRDSNSLLATMFNGKETSVICDSKGRYFIDRDGVLFRFILDYLRNNECILPDGFLEIDRLLIEAEYFQMKGLVEALHNLASKRNNGCYLTLSVRGTFAFGRDGQSDVKFRKLQKILVCGDVAVSRKIFGDSLNETRDPERDDDRYSHRFFLKHNHIEKAFDQFNSFGFKLMTSCGGGAGYDDENEESKWNNFKTYVFYGEK